MPPRACDVPSFPWPRTARMSSTPSAPESSCLARSGPGGSRASPPSPSQLSAALVPFLAFLRSPHLISLSLICVAPPPFCKETAAMELQLRLPRLLGSVGSRPSPSLPDSSASRSPVAAPSVFCIVMACCCFCSSETKREQQRLARSSVDRGLPSSFASWATSYRPKPACFLPDPSWPSQARCEQLPSPSQFWPESLFFSCERFVYLS